LDNEVYKSDEFAEYAKKNLVLVKADFPRRVEQSDELKKANEKLKEKYATPFEGYPTTVIVDKDGTKLGQKVGYRPGSGPKAFIQEIDNIPKKS
jgi:thioredoxin-related protein